MVDLIWSPGRCMVALTKCKLPVTKGGLVDTDFELYFLAAQFQLAAWWVGGLHIGETEVTEAEQTSDKRLYE